MIAKESLLVFLVFCATSCYCTDVIKCNTRNTFIKGVAISGCQKPVCLLKKNTAVTIEQEFVPSNDVDQVTTIAKGIILGLPLSFIGVDGTDACSKIYVKESNVKTSCPLKQGVTYVYRNQFTVLPLYPSISLKVLWALEDSPRKQKITCFEVPVKISN